MAASFFFYDLETSGFSPRDDRIMQFGGQRTDMDLQPIGEPVNVFVKLTPDVLPTPDAIVLTGITPQQTINDGLTEAEFLKFFYEEVVQPDTIFLGFNSIRFDDEFMRFLHYRNFYDAYEWQWKDGCSRWDTLDLVRTTRALKPEGIEWPFGPDGKPANRLEYLSKVNKLLHTAAHDALSDVEATIAVAKLIKTKQPKLFDYLVQGRSKDQVKKIVESGKPFMYTSGRYGSQHLHTTAAVMIGKHAERGEALVYDLRHDPAPFLDMSVDQLIEAWKYTRDPDVVRLPVKTLKYNRCPAVVPGVVSDAATLERLELSHDVITKNLATISKQAPAFVEKLFTATQRMDEERERAQTSLVDNALTVDGRLYDGFVGPADKLAMDKVRHAAPETLSDFTGTFKDARLNNLLPLYTARNYPQVLSAEQRQAWDEFCHHRLFDGGNQSKAQRYFERLAEVAADKPTVKQQFILEELQLYGQAILPADATD